MSAVMDLMRAEIGVAITVGLLAASLLVCTAVGLLMKRGGVSTRPAWWLAGLFLLIVVPQVAGHLWRAGRAVQADAPRQAALQQADDAGGLFGPDVDPQLVADARAVMGGAEQARFAALPGGESVLLARFPSSSAAEQGWVNYLRASGLNGLRGEGDSQRGWLVTRPAGDRAYALHLNRWVGVWTGTSDEAIRRRMAAGGFDVPRGAPLAKPAAGMAAEPEMPLGPIGLALAAGGLALYTLAVVMFFFKGAAWAGTYRAPQGTARAGAAELAARLESLNALDAPFRIERGARPDEFYATWRYADAKWMDLARVRGLRRTWRIQLTLDEAAGVVRATDQATSLEWSAGQGGADLAWSASKGIVFFHREHQREYGLRLDAQGRFAPLPGYAWTFRLDELKAPLVQATTQAGWHWRPAVWQGPRWLRWITD